MTLNNGVKMPLVGFGTWTLRGEQGKQVVLEALAAGYRLIDTAHMYGNEDIVGQAVAESGIPREEIFITTKLCGQGLVISWPARGLKNLWTGCRPII